MESAIELRRAKDREYGAKRRALHKDEIRANWRRYYHNNREAYREKSRLAAQRSRLLDPDKYRNRLRRAQGLPEPTRPEPEFCECCGGPHGENRKAFCLDHNHATGEFRGWLCGACNKGIGNLGDNLEGVKNAVRYLER